MIEALLASRLCPASAGSRRIIRILLSLCYIPPPLSLSLSLSVSLLLSMEEARIG
jgi:hypothetical protein